MNINRKDFTNCVVCGDNFTKSSHLAKGFCRKCYGKNYYSKNKDIKDYFTRRKEKKDKHLVSLREKNKQKLYDFIDYTHRNRFLIDYVNALRLADLYEIYYTGSTNQIDGLKVEDQLIYMWDFINKLKKETPTF